MRLSPAFTIFLLRVINKGQMSCTKVKMETKQALVVIPPPPPKFNLTEWHLNNSLRYRCSETQQILADRVLTESDRIRDLTKETAQANKAETDHRLKEKLNDIQFCKKELLKIRKDIVLEIDALSMYKERIMDALSALRQNALLICKKCLIAREHRLGIDLVSDDVERELMKEVEVIKGVDNLLAQILEQSHEQLRRLKATLYYVDHDLEDKENNLRIDSHNLTLKETSLNLSTYHGTSRLDPSTITLVEWERQTNDNIVAATKELNCAKPLRSYIDTVIRQAINDLRNQKNRTDEAFNIRIATTKDTKMRLELQHSEVMRQANEMTENITRITKAMAEKEGFMALAHTRLGNRCQRPGLELTRDQVEVALIREVQDLRQILMDLQRRRYEAEASLRYLLRIQMQLEEDINVKTNTLKIDEVECTSLRHSMNYQAY